MKRLLRFFFVVAVLVPNFGISQDVAVEAQQPVLVVNLEQLFSDSKIGQDIRAEFDVLQSNAQRENDRLIAELTSEEQNLAARRSEMTVEAFRAEAEAFDSKVQSIRAERDAKDRELTQARANAEERFREQVRGVVGDVMLERGGVVVLDNRTVFIALRTVDITQAVIEKLDAFHAQQNGNQ